MGLVQSVCDMTLGELAPCEFRLTAVGSRCVYVEGVKSVRSFSPSEVVLGLKKSCLKIKGAGLCVKKFSGQDAAVTGEVACIERIPL